MKLKTHLGTVLVVGSAIAAFTAWAACTAKLSTSTHVDNTAEGIGCDGTNVVASLCKITTYANGQVTETKCYSDGTDTSYQCNHSGDFWHYVVVMTGTPVCPDEICIDYRQTSAGNQFFHGDSLDWCWGGG